MTNTIAQQVRDIVATQFRDQTISTMLIASGPGLGRNAVLRESLEEHYAGRFVIIDAASPLRPEDLARYAQQLDNAEIVVFDGAGFATPEVREAIYGLAIEGSAGPFPVKYRPAEHVLLADHALVVFSEQYQNADLIENDVTAALGSETFRRFDL